MIQDILKTIPGVARLPIVGLILFFGLFIAIIIWAFFRLDKQYVKRMEELPLDVSNSSHGD